jgi:beta-glucanase (GH16 family)
MKKFTKLLFILFIITQMLISYGCKQNNKHNKITSLIPPIKGDFTLIHELSDEFEETGIDTTRWYPINPTWEGRQPAFFSDKNVIQKEGKLNLIMRKEDPPASLKDKGFHTFSSAAVQSRKKVKYGYFEIKARAMNSKGSSAFWFYNGTKDLWTEIDVFEICGTGERENQYNMNLHVFHTPLIKEHFGRGGEWRAPYRFADDFHVFGLEWTPFVIRWYVDGIEVRTAENTHWHQPLTMNFDSETMPDWFGLPEENELPSTFIIEYVRSWKFNTADWME